jgi:hypothetical protein
MLEDLHYTPRREWLKKWQVTEASYYNYLKLLPPMDASRIKRKWVRTGAELVKRVPAPPPREYQLFEWREGKWHRVDKVS